MANKKKFYAVKNGNSIGVFETWTECQKSINGYSNAEYKSFTSYEEAKAYIDGKDIYMEMIETDINNGYLVVYTDGSYNDKTKKYSYGVVIFDKNKNKFTLSGNGQNPKYIDSKNIAGEVIAVINALDWAISNSYNKIKIYHDYEGIPYWIKGEWKANSDIAKSLVYIVNNTYKDLIDIKFEHIKGHTNNKFNEEADRLAKSALEGICKKEINGENWFSTSKIDKEDLKSLIDCIKDDYPNLKYNLKSLSNRDIFKLELSNEKITITSYNVNGNKVLVQGKNTSFLFQIFITYLCELIEDKELISVLSSAYRVSINNNKQIKKQFDDIFPTFPSDYPNNIKKLIKQSIININIYIESELYNQYVYPILIALDGHLKYLFKQIGITICKKTGYCYFNKPGYKYVLKPEITVSQDEKENIEKCYNFYTNNRNVLVHYGDLMGSTDNTRIIENFSEAKEIVQKTLNLIQETL